MTSNVSDADADPAINATANNAAMTLSYCSPSVRFIAEHLETVTTRCIRFENTDSRCSDIARHCCNFFQPCAFIHASYSCWFVTPDCGGS